MKKITVYAATATHTKFGEKIMKLYSDPSKAFNHVKKCYEEEMAKRHEAEAKGEGKIVRYSDSECWYEWADREYDNDWKFDFKERFWVKCMNVD